MLTCEEFVKKLSSYIDGDVDVYLRIDVERHLHHCRRCSAVLDSTRKMLYIVSDDRVFELPVGYSKRLHAFLDHALRGVSGPTETDA